ncbi:hypothetical protein Tco_0915900 [Tanacetum coccineum]
MDGWIEWMDGRVSDDEMDDRLIDGTGSIRMDGTMDGWTARDGMERHQMDWLDGSRRMDGSMDDDGIDGWMDDRWLDDDRWMG